MNKKILSLLALMLCAVMMLTACGSKETNADNNASGKSERVVIYTAAEDERIAYIQQELDAKFPNYEIVIQSLGTGQLLSKLQAEGKNSDCDIFYDLEVVNAEIILNADPDLFVDLSSYDFSIYDSSVTGYTDRHHKYAVNGKTAGAFLVNTRMLEEKGLSIPHTYEDMLNPEYRSLISIPSPKSSGTGYSFYNGMITILGEEDGLNYFEELQPNIKEYAATGSAPAKSVVNEDVAIAYGLLWQCVNYANNYENLRVIVPDQGLAFDLFTMGIVSGHETKGSVREVFTFLFNDLNRSQCALFNPDKIYVDMPAADIQNYPIDYNEITMKGLFDFQYKRDLLHKWEY